MLANVEDRLMADPNGTIDSMSFEAQKEKLRKKMNCASLEKFEHKTSVAGSSIPKQILENNKKIEEKKEHDAKETDISEPILTIVSNVDLSVSNFLSTFSFKLIDLFSNCYLHFRYLRSIKIYYTKFCII